MHGLECLYSNDPYSKVNLEEKVCKEHYVVKDCYNED